MDGMLKLHPDLGVNPRLTQCPQCGADSGVVLLGVNDKVGTCTTCNRVVYGLGPHPNCTNHTKFEDVREIGEHDKIPGLLCSPCADQQKEFKRIAAAGGVYWRCLKCKKNGVIRAEADAAKAVRSKLKIEPPSPCGIEFNGPGCPICTPPPTEGEL